MDDCWFSLWGLPLISVQICTTSNWSNTLTVGMMACSDKGGATFPRTLDLGNFRLALACANRTFPTLGIFISALLGSFSSLLTPELVAVSCREDVGKGASKRTRIEPALGKR